MGAVLGLLIVGALVWSYVVWQGKAARADAAAQAAGRAMHLRGAAFPATCSWCKDTSVAHRLMVFEQVDERWRPYDVRAGLASVPDHAVEGVVSTMFHHPSPRWRRFCTEKCARDFFASEQIAAVEAFGPCAYCATRFPMSLVHCPHCAAARTSR